MIHNWYYFRYDLWIYMSIYNIHRNTNNEDIWYINLYITYIYLYFLYTDSQSQTQITIYRRQIIHIAIYSYRRHILLSQQDQPQSLSLLLLIRYIKKHIVGYPNLKPASSNHFSCSLIGTGTSANKEIIWMLSWLKSKSSMKSKITNNYVVSHFSTNVLFLFSLFLGLLVYISIVELHCNLLSFIAATWIMFVRIWQWHCFTLLNQFNIIWS